MYTSSIQGRYSGTSQSKISVDHKDLSDASDLNIIIPPHLPTGSPAKKEGYGNGPGKALKRARFVTQI